MLHLQQEEEDELDLQQQSDEDEELDGQQQGDELELESQHFFFLQQSF